MGNFFCKKNNILDNVKIKKYISTIKNLEYYSKKQINRDEEGNYIFPILPDLDIYNDKSLVKYYSSFTNSNEIKVFNYLDIELHDIPINTYNKNMLGLYCLVIGIHKKDFVLSIIERDFQNNCENILFREPDLYNGFIPEEDCKNIKIFIDNILFEEFNNCKKHHYYQLKIPLIVFLMKDKITVQIDKDNAKINFVVTFLNNGNLELRDLFIELIFGNIFSYQNKILGTYLGIDNNKKTITLKYCNNKLLIHQLLYYKHQMLNFYSLQYLNNLKTRYIEKELIEKTWHPNRFMDWCLDIEEKADFIYNDCSCENKRIMEISQDINHRPLIFIRFNPDDYKKREYNITSCWGIGRIMYYKTK